MNCKTIESTNSPNFSKKFASDTLYSAYSWPRRMEKLAQGPGSLHGAENSGCEPFSLRRDGSPASLVGEGHTACRVRMFSYHCDSIMCLSETKSTSRLRAFSSARSLSAMWPGRWCAGTAAKCHYPPCSSSSINT